MPFEQSRNQAQQIIKLANGTVEKVFKKDITKKGNLVYHCTICDAKNISANNLESHSYGKTHLEIINKAYKQGIIVQQLSPGFGNNEEYICNVCGPNSFPRGKISEHIDSQDHQQNYLEEYFPSVLKLILRENDSCRQKETLLFVCNYIAKNKSVIQNKSVKVFSESWWPNCDSIILNEVKKWREEKENLQFGIINRTDSLLDPQNCKSQDDFNLMNEEKLNDLFHQLNLSQLHAENAVKTDLSLNVYKKNNTEEYIFKEKTLELLKKYKSSEYKIVYTDASVTTRKAGWGFHTDTFEDKGAFLGKAIIQDAELFAILKASEWALQCGHKKVLICLDCLPAVEMLENSHMKNNFVPLIKDKIQGLDYVIMWIPGHVGIPGNEAADLLARQGAELKAKKRTTQNDDQLMEAEHSKKFR